MGKKSKGPGFERKTFKRLSRWFSQGESDDIFWRTAGSGARATTRAKKGIGTADSAGDMSAIHPSGKALTRVSIWELKKGYSGETPSKRIGLLNIIDSKEAKNPPLLIQWIKKVETEAKIHKRKLWFIIFERDRKNACICTKKSTMDYLKRRNHKSFCSLQESKSCDFFINGHSISVTPLEEFLCWCEPQTIVKAIIRRTKGVK
jgi:hypothetical protein